MVDAVAESERCSTGNSRRYRTRQEIRELLAQA